MNREVINGILNDVESNNAAFAGGKMTSDEYAKRQRELHARLNVYGLGLMSVAVTPPF
jgi:hypothetical protein